VEELAYGLASAVEQIRALLAPGALPGGQVPQVRFEFAVGPRILPEIAKIRAARLLWARAAAAFGAPPEQRVAVIHARGALRDKTRYDQHANLLRAAVAAFAAVVAGCDSQETARFDVAADAPDPMAQRLALNTQHLLRDEAHLGRVLDPAGGAYALETLTDALARKAWALFQEIESHGGMLTSLWGGIPQERLAALAAERARRVAERRRVLVGTNRYADPDERLPAAPPPPERHEDTLYPQRDAEAFERVRARADARSPRLHAFLANVGPREQFRPRADFVADLLHSGGIAVLDPPGFPDAETAATAAAASGAQIVVMCASDAAYPALVPDLIARLRAMRPNMVFALAGYPEPSVELLQQAGVDVFLHLRANAVEALTTLLDRTEEARR
jgi:methylmalonyl-CoA mutase